MADISNSHREEIAGILFEKMNLQDGNLLFVKAPRDVFKDSDVIGLAEHIGMTAKRQGRHVVCIVCHESLEMLELDETTMRNCGWARIPDHEKKPPKT